MGHWIFYTWKTKFNGIISIHFRYGVVVSIAVSHTQVRGRKCESSGTS